MKAVFSVATLLLISVCCFAQFSLGIANSNWCSTNSMLLNPGNIAESRERKIVSLLSVNTGVDNNVGPFNSKAGIFLVVGDGRTDDMFRYVSKKRVAMHAPYMDIIGPGVMWRLDSSQSIAISTRLRGMNQFNNFDQTLFHTFNDKTFVTPKDVLGTQKDFNYTVHLWSEIGVTYGRVFFDNGRHKIKAGATARYLLGIAYVGVDGRNMDVKFQAGNDTFFAGNLDIDYTSNILNTRSSQGDNISNNFFSLLAKRNFGHGFGGDAGVVYEYKPAGSKKKDGYSVRISASLCDIGFVTYSGHNNVSEHFSGSGYVTGKGILDYVKNLENIKKYAEKRGFKGDIQNVTSKVYMPTRLMLSGDYHINKNCYTNITFLLNLANRERYGNSYYNQFTVTPRYETKKVTLGLPITYSTLSNRFKGGIGVMSGGVFIGSDDILSLMFKSEYGVNFYAGINVPMYK